MTVEASQVSESVVERWRTAAPWLEPLTGPAKTAESLLLIVHYSIDFDGWIGRRRETYWDQVLPSRVWQVTYRVDTLDWWWAEVARALDACPSSPALRRELAQLLRSDPMPVLDVLRREAVALVLRVRLIAEAVRGQRQVNGVTL